MFQVYFKIQTENINNIFIIQSKITQCWINQGKIAQGKITKGQIIKNCNTHGKDSLKLPRAKLLNVKLP